MKVLLSNIQRFSLQDGPGIRTTVFLKGCSIECPWCANPENLHGIVEDYYEDGIISGQYGYYMTTEELEMELLKDQIFYDKHGGITYSGGEALLQIKQLELLLRKMHIKGIHQCIETALFVPIKNVLIAMEFIDLFIVDIKILDQEACRTYLKGNIEIYLENIKELFANHKDVIFRFPVISPYTTNINNINILLSFLNEYRPLKIEIFKIHKLAEKKYDSLKMKLMDVEYIEDRYMEELAEKIRRIGIKTEICKL